MKLPKIWTQEEIERAIILRGEDWTWAEMAPLFGVSQVSIRHKISRIITPRKQKIEREKRLALKTREPKHDYRMTSEQRGKASTMLHLRDIHREHGFNRMWPSYTVEPATAVYIPRLVSADLSFTGSPALMCEGN